MALGYDLRSDDTNELEKSSLIVLNSISFSLSAISILFLISFQINGSISLSWFFFAEAIAFVLIPILARKGYELSSKLLLLAYVNIGILILSSVMGEDLLIQAFFVPAIGLAILLFDQKQLRLRNIGIGFSIFSYLILDYVVFEKVYLSAGGYWYLKWGILSAAFISTWMIFNKFSDYRERAEGKTRELLEEQKELNAKLNAKTEELEQNLEKLEQAKQKVEMGSRAKSEFLSTMSHEIRTPMNAIIGMTNLLAEDNPREDQLEQIEILNFSAKTLMALINDILDFSKIESGKIEIENNRFVLRQIVKGVIESFRFNARKKDIALDMQVEDEIPRVLIGDPARLTQILNNLVSNAVKFTEQGRVDIRVRSLERDETKNRVRLQFAVSDTGVGIAVDKREHIFESFTQERTETSRIFGGTGLGLTISKKLVDLFGGSIYLDSEKGEGSTFYVELEMEVAEQQKSTGGEDADRSEAENLEGVEVLVVEDNQINQKVMERYLDRWNMNISVASNGVEALKAVEQHRFSIILMDLQMPEMDGYEATRKIRTMEDPGKSNIPIIALTAAALKEVKERVYASGMNDFVTKPFNPSDLHTKLKQYLVKLS